MRLRDNLLGLIGDHFPDKEEAEGIVNHIMYFVIKREKPIRGLFFVLGMCAMAIILRWFS